MPAIFDAHLDLAWNALSFGRDLTLPLDELRRREAHMTDHRCRGRATVSLPELQRADVRICVATLLARSSPGDGASAARGVAPSIAAAPPDHLTPALGRFSDTTIARTDLDHASQSIAYAAARGQLAYYELLEAQGHIRIIRTAAQLDEYWTRRLSLRAPGTRTFFRGAKDDATRASADLAPIGVILSMEGADPVVSPSQLDHWWSLGLRAIGPVHYGHSHYAAGTGVTGGLTQRGQQLVKRMSALGFLLDVTHLCDESLAEALDLHEGPVLASHHNCRALVGGDRQLTDEQIKRLVSRGGVIGAALDAWMLYPGWKRGETQPDVVSLNAVADHIGRVCQLAGDALHAGIGSDLDGGFGFEQTPRDLNTIADLQNLDGILESRGYSEADRDAIFHGNFLRLFSDALP